MYTYVYINNMCFVAKMALSNSKNTGNRRISLAMVNKATRANICKGSKQPAKITIAITNIIKVA